MSADNYSGDIAIIGMSGAFPGARTLHEFYSSLCEGREMIRFLTPEEQGINGNGFNSYDPRFIPAVAAMNGVDLFDASFFAMTSQEAELTDPQHRLLLEYCWRAIEHAGYDTQRYPNMVGVFAGATINTYLMQNLLRNLGVMQGLDPLQLNIGNGSDFLTTRISYKLNLKGPSHTVQSACSTSLVAVHCGCRSLLDLECDMALAGGVSVNVNFLRGYKYQDGGIMSRDGHCRVFDANASGTIFASGVGVVVLKRLEDAIADRDTIHAVIKGSAINNDGGLKAGYTAPSVEGQAEVIAEAMANAGIDPETVNYVECHGTGTLLGDPVEVRALTKAFRASTQKQGFCALGSVKSNLGHLDAAAGVTGLIKVVLSLKHGMLPPSLHFKEPNPQIDFSGSPFYVNTELREWKREGGPRRAGVSAFGVGGTNAHVIVEEAPEERKVEGESEANRGGKGEGDREEEERGREWQLLVVSGRSGSALRQACRNLGEHLEKEGGKGEELKDVAYTLQVGRRAFAYRWAGVCRSGEEAVGLLESGGGEEGLEGVEEGRREVGFLFPGQGSQYAGMGEELYRKEKVFRDVLEECSEILEAKLGMKLVEGLYGKRRGEVEQTWLAQPGIFAVEYGLVQLWKSWGVEARGMLGHSIGEYVAACVGGVMTLEEALGVVAVRGQLMQGLPRSGMVAVEMREEELCWAEEKGVSIAAVNGPGQCVLSGLEEEMEWVEEELRRKGVNYKRLKTSHGFHSRAVEGVMGAFLEEMKKVKLKASKVGIISNVSGRWMGKEVEEAEYWVRHLRACVQFEKGLKEMVREGEWMLVECGPGQGLRRLAQRQGLGERTVSSLPVAGSGGSEVEKMVQAAGELWKVGVGIDWEGLHGGEWGRRVPLPTYPFERKRYWIEPSTASSPTNTIRVVEEPVSVPPVRKESSHYAPRPALRNNYIAPHNEAEQKAVAILEEALGIRPIGVTDQYGELGGDSLTAVRVIDQLNTCFQSDLRVVDLYEGLAIRDLVHLIANESVAIYHDVGGSAKADRRQLYQQSRRSLHQKESA